jgi:cell wall-associated NlpC family hydrolase
LRRLDPRGERGAVAIASAALLLVLALVAGAGLTAGRGLLLDERAHGEADAVALAAASVLEQRYGQAVDAGGSPASLRATERAAHAAAARAAERLGVLLVAIAFERGARDPSPLAVRVSVTVNGDHGARARAGVAFAQPVAAEGFRIADVRGLDAASAVVTAALAQLGWPYVWGGESRAEGGFDCSGLVDYALAAAGLPVGRLTAAGLQQLARPLPVGAGLRPGDLVFVGEPAHHVGLVVAPGLAVEAPHRGALVHVEALGEGGWTGAGRLLPASPTVEAEGELAVPRYVPMPLRPLVARAARAEQLPPALLAAQLEAESGFDATARSAAGAQGIAQFMPATWAGAWNPQRSQSPFEPGPAIAAQARLMHLLLERAGGDVASALAAYNAGPGALAGFWPRETRAYVARIVRRFGGPATLGAALPLNLADAGAAPASSRTEVRLLP